MITIEEIQQLKTRITEINRQLLLYVDFLNSKTDLPLTEDEHFSLEEVHVGDGKIAVWVKAENNIQTPLTRDEVLRYRHIQTYYVFAVEELNKFLNENSTSSEATVLEEVSE